MKLFTLLAFLGCLMFNTVDDSHSTEAETMVQSQTETSVERPSSLDDRIGCIMPVGPISFSGSGCSGFGLCIEDPFPYPTFPIPRFEFNQANGTASLDDDGTINLKIDGNTFSSEFRSQITEDPTFILDNNYRIPQELVNELYSCGGQAAPDEVVIPAGKYSARPTPWGLILTAISELDIKIKFSFEFECC